MNGLRARLDGGLPGLAPGVVLALAGAIFLAMLAILLAPARANHSFAATYAGNAATGGTVELDVSADGSAVTRFAATDVPTTCGTVTVTSTGNVPITDHSFNSTSGQLHYGGSFPANQQATGTLSLHIPGFPSCTSDDVAWNATTSTPPPDGGQPPPDGGQPPPDGGQPPPAGGQPPPAGGDTTPPDTSLSGRKTQQAGKAIKVGVSCNEACSAVGSGKVVVTGSTSSGASAAARVRQTFKLKRATAEVAAGDTKTLRLKPKSRKAKRTIAKLVETGANAKAKVVVKTTDAAGNTDTAKRTIKLK